MTTPELAAIAARCAAATEGPWYTVQSPWRANYYNKATDLYEMIGTYVVAGVPDPHVGTPVLDSIEIDEWDGDTGPDYSQSDADLNFAAHARTDIPDLLAYIDKLEAVVQAARDLHGYHAFQRQVSRADGESVACPCPICVEVERLDRA